jgi:hypothetical protein
LGITAVQNKSFYLTPRIDTPSVQEIYNQLTQRSYKVWFDQNILIAGQEWDIEIKKAISASRIFLPIISSKGIAKRGYFQKELRRSLSVAEEIPEGTIYIIPVLLYLDEECAESLPEVLQKYHWLIWQGISAGGQLERALDFALGIDRVNSDWQLVRHPLGYG